MNEKIWKTINSLWIIPTLIIFINGLPLIFVGLHVNQRKWVLMGILFELPVFLFSIVYTFEIPMLNSTLAFLSLISILMSFIYALTIRKTYLEMLKAKGNPSINFRENNYQNNTEPTHHELEQSQPRQQSYNTMDLNNQETFEKININTASIDEIEQLPGVNVILAKKIVYARNKGKKFRNIEELGDYLNITPIHMHRLEPYIKFNANGTDNISNRRLDL